MAENRRVNRAGHALAASFLSFVIFLNSPMIPPEHSAGRVLKDRIIPRKAVITKVSFPLPKSSGQAVFFQKSEESLR
jgi:hypothetical protein